jgi:hypothetical protein
MKQKLFPAVIVCAAIIPTLANAQILVNDNFDSYADHTAFTNVWTPIGTSGTLSALQSVSAPNSVNMATTAQRNGRSFTESGLAAGLTAIRFSLDYYDSDSTAAPYRQYANLQDGASPGGSGQLVSLGLNNNLLSAADGGNFFMARILGYNSNNYFKLNDNPSLLRTTGWHNLAVIISDLDFKFYVDGQLAETVAQTGLTLRSYDVVRIGSGLSSTREVFYDNVRVEVIQVPEPTTAALLGLGLSGLIAARRMRK